MYNSIFFGIPDVKSIRQVCSKWKVGVDKYFQTTNFHCLETNKGATNISHVVLTMPLELDDISRIHEMELHPVCVSFGKKLTLLMRHDQLNNGLFPNHLREINLLLHTVTLFWQRFEHLDVRRLYGFTEADDDRIRRREQRHENPYYIHVPFGDVGSDEKLHRWCSKFYKFYEPQDFIMYIPFLHLLTNLKKISIHTRDYWVTASILRHIPKTSNLEEIYMEPDDSFLEYDEYWRTTCAILIEKCAKSVIFLAGVSADSIVFKEPSTYSNNVTGPVFEQLKEIHIIVDSDWTTCALDSMHDFTIASMFPLVTTLVLSVDIRYAQCDHWKYLGNFVRKFPRLKHFSLSGDCVRDWNTCLHTLPEVKTGSFSTILEKHYSILTVFQFQCPIHVPTGLLQFFPSVKHVIVDEFSERCERHASKSKDLKYVNDFFNMFANVSSLSFVPVTSGDQTHAASTDRKKLTYFRGKYTRNKLELINTN